MPRIKPVWINGRIGKEFHDLIGILSEAKRQARRILHCENVHVIHVIPVPQFDGYVALVIPGGSDPPSPPGGGGEKRLEDG